MRGPTPEYHAPCSMNIIGISFVMMSKRKISPCYKNDWCRDMPIRDRNAVYIERTDKALGCHSATTSFHQQPHLATRAWRNPTYRSSFQKLPANHKIEYYCRLRSITIPSVQYGSTTYRLLQGSPDQHHRDQSTIHNDEWQPAESWSFPE